MKFGIIFSLTGSGSKSILAFSSVEFCTRQWSAGTYLANALSFHFPIYIFGLLTHNLDRRWLTQHTVRRPLPSARVAYAAVATIPPTARNNASLSTHWRRSTQCYIAHTYQFPSSPWASAQYRCMVSALGSRVGWTPARKERTNEPWII